MRHDHRFKTIATNAVHAGCPRPHVEGAVVTPIFQSANYLMGDEASYDSIGYIRLSNSINHQVLAARLAALEGGGAALVTASGMAAMTTAILAFVRSGEHLLVQRTLYGGTQSFLDVDAADLGIGVTAFDPADPDRPASWERALKPTTKMILVESISNPLMEVGDLEQVVAFAKAHDLVTLIDNTFATPVNFRPLSVGFDLVVHSASKYLNGHSDLVAGAVVGSEEHVRRVYQRLIHFGGALDPHACFLLERGLKTLPLRVERQNASAQRLAELLAAHPRVRRVCYPGLPDDAAHAFARSLFSGYGGMLSFYAESAEVAVQFLRRVRIPLHAVSLGGVESLVVRPARSSHMAQTEEQRLALGITDELVRVSVGVEDVDELWADFEQALA